MANDNVAGAINVRYSELATQSCCLSCGGAINHGEAQKGEVCVDLGSGRGNDVIRLSEMVGPEGRVYGIDISDGMLDKARATAKRFSIDNAEFVQSDLETLPLPNDHIDLFISNCTINHAENKQSVWNEVHRCLKKGGRFVVSDIFSTAEVPVQYRNDPEAVAECWAGSVTREEYLSQLENAGFKEIQIIEESDPYPKGSIEVVSWTILGVKPSSCCSCQNK